MPVSLEHRQRVVAHQEAIERAAYEQTVRELPPYQRGFAAGFAGTGRAPDFPTGTSSWSQKLYARGWSDGVAARLRAAGGRVQS